MSKLKIKNKRYFCMLKVLAMLAISFILWIIPYVHEVEAADANLSAWEKFSHTAWSSSWGTKTFVYKSDYLAEQTSDSTNKIVRNHDFTAYKCPQDIIWPPEVGNGEVRLYKVEMLDSNGSTYSPIYGSDFSNGVIYSRLLCGDNLTFLAKIYHPDQKASKNLSLRNRVNTWFFLSEDWIPSTWLEDYAYTNWY